MPTPEVQTLSEPSSIFTLQNNTEYTIKVSLCNQASIFHFGMCYTNNLNENIIMMNQIFRKMSSPWKYSRRISTQSYIIDMSSTMGVLLMDVFSNRSVIMNCNNNGVLCISYLIVKL